MRRALVTGVGHKQGIGYAVAMRLSQRGDRVFVTRSGAFDAARSHSHDREVQWSCIDADLGEPDAARIVLTAAEAAIGRIDVLVINHAYFEKDDLDTLRPNVLDRHLAVNVRGAILLAQGFAARNDSGWGRIVFMTSGQSLHPMPESLSYAVSKGAIEAASLSIAASVASKGITVNTVDPGGTDTGWMPPEMHKRWANESPRGRVGEAGDAARLIAFLTGEDASWITGQLIRSRGSV